MQSYQAGQEVSWCDLQQLRGAHYALGKGFLEVVHLHQQLLIQLILAQLYLVPILASPTGLHHCPGPSLLCTYHQKRLQYLTQMDAPRIAWHTGLLHAQNALQLACNGT